MKTIPNPSFDTVFPASITDKSKPYVRIRFVHFRDGKEHEFYSCVNDLTGSRMTAFDSSPPSIDEPMAYVKSVVRDIHRKATKVLWVVQSRHFDGIPSPVTPTR